MKGSAGSAGGGVSAGGSRDGGGTLFDDTPVGNGDGTVVALHEAARARYLNYALSVITSRAIPDVRDGLKPVHRRILFSMWQQGVRSDAKHRKCAKVVGDVMGSYHPHGDTAIYDALVRMAQPFSLRIPLVDGSGNFGSLDGDAPAAMRYTECRLAPSANEMLAEIGQRTVDFRPTYDGTKNEPVVLPARLPNLIVNGGTGIAVGMATNIPPHSLFEVCNALLKLVENPELQTYQLLGKSGIQGPDFPTGGQVLNSPAELRDIYKSGSGAVRMRATTRKGPATRGGKTLIITSVPYGVNKAVLVAQIGEIVVAQKLPLLLDVRDVSTDDVRVELLIRKDADEDKVLAYLYRHTSLATNFNVNLTCLVPTRNPEAGRPQRCDLREILNHFLLFRLQVVTRRLENELEQRKQRIHLLKGFEVIFDALDQVIKIIRGSDGKADAAKKIIARFKIDAGQTDAILELKLYRLAKLEILAIRKELAEKRKRAREIERLLKNEEARWRIVRDEIKEIRDKYGKNDKRRTVVATVEKEPEFSEEELIIAEDNVVIVTRDGWVKRQKEVRDLSTTRLREGDSVLTAQAGSTRATVVFLSSLGVAYTCRIADIPATTGHGQPVQKLFRLKDGERIVAAYALDARTIGDVKEDPKKPEYAPATHAIAVSSDGYSLRFGLEAFIEPSTRTGRRFARPAKTAEIVAIKMIHGDETALAASTQRRVMVCPVEEVNYLSGPGKGVMLIKLARDDRLIGFTVATDDRDTLTVKTSMGGEQRINTARYEVTGRGGKGREVIKKGSLIEVVHEEASVSAMLGEQ